MGAAICSPPWPSCRSHSSGRSGRAVGFALVYWDFHVGKSPAGCASSGSALFTLGFSEPANERARLAHLGRGDDRSRAGALLIGYLPDHLRGYDEHERGVGLLRPVAGVPPTATELLIRMHQMGTVNAPDLWNRATDWLIDLEQSHCSFPALCYFPTQSPASPGWPGRGRARQRGVGGGGPGRGRGCPRPGQILTYGSTAVVRIGQKSGLPLEGPPSPADVTAVDGPTTTHLAAAARSTSSSIGSSGPA